MYLVKEHHKTIMRIPLSLSVVMAIVPYCACVSHYYQTLPHPISIPSAHENGLMISAGVPNDLEYQRRIGSNADLLIQGGYSKYPLSAKWADTAKLESVDTTPTDLFSTALMARYWLTDPLRNGFEFGVYGGLSGSLTCENRPLVLAGIIGGIAPGFHTRHFGAAIPVSMGFGKTRNGMFLQIGDAIQMQIMGDHFGAGGRVGLIIGKGEMDTIEMFHVPVECNVFATFGF